jgi:hypothetical protein
MRFEHMRPHAQRKRELPRHREPWTAAEDRRLLRALAKVEPGWSERELVFRIAPKLRRSFQGVQARIMILRQAVRLAKVVTSMRKRR